MGKGTLVKRTVSGVLFVAVVVAGLLHPVATLALTLLLAVGLSREFYQLASRRRYRKEEILVVAAIVLTLALFFGSRVQGAIPAAYLLLGALPVLLAFICQLFDGAPGPEFVTEPYFPLVYILPALLSLLCFPWRISLGLFVILWCSDIGAYCLGMLLGQREGGRKLFPALSPKKSWAGVLGGALFAFLAAWGYGALWGAPALPLVHWFALSLLVLLFGIPGDLFESLIKRHAGVKDAGTLIPGHGGLLDRFDDFLFVAPAAFLYLKLFSLL